MKVYIARHGQIPSNSLGRHTNPYEDLTDVGIKQAEQLREKIKDIHFDVIISSPFLRARHTTDILNIHKCKVVIEDRIAERSCGNLSGRPLYEENREEYWNYNTKLKFGTAEEIKPFFKRVFEFIEDLKLEKYNTVLIVAHSGVSKAFSAYFDGIKDGMFLNRGLKNCEIKEYEL